MPALPPRIPALAAGLAGLLALAAAAPLAAQDVGSPLERPRSFGLLAGVNFASFGGDDGEDLEDRRTGFVVGGFAVLRVSPALAFQPEVLYAQKGAGGTFSDGAETARVELNLSYLEVPLLLRVDVPGGTSVRPFLLGGPSIAFNTGCQAKFSLGSESASVDCDGDESLDPNTFDVGALLGGGLEFPLGTRSLSIGVRYTFGFSDVASDVDAQNRTLGIVAGLRF